jgi:hypothetical protein
MAMIEIPRSLARRLRAVFRRCARQAKLAHPPAVLFQTSREGLWARLPGPDVAVAYHQPGGHAAAAELAVPLIALDDFAGRGDEPVVLEDGGDGRVQARGGDAGVPQQRSYEVTDRDKLPAFPAAPARWSRNEPALLGALAEAAQVAADSAGRYALSCLQLGGSQGRVAATDGRQLFIQEGFALGREDFVLVPATTVFAAKELPRDLPVEIGRTPTHLAVRVGDWTVCLRIKSEARFPAIDQVVPLASTIASRCLIGFEDAAFLERTLSRLPGHQDDAAAVTVDLNNQVFIRAKAADEKQVTEVVLSRSTASGKPVRFATNRKYLARALALGFTELEVVDANTPVLCQDGRRRYVWMPLGKDDAIAPTDQAVRIESGTTGAVAAKANGRIRQPQTVSIHAPTSAPPSRLTLLQPGEDEPAGVPMSQPGPPQPTAQGPKPVSARPAEDGGLQALIEEAEALKGVLRDAYTRTHHLLTAARRQRKQAHAVKAAMASLRQLQQASA